MFREFDVLILSLQHDGCWELTWIHHSWKHLNIVNVTDGDYVMLPGCLCVQQEQKVMCVH